MRKCNINGHSQTQNEVQRQLDQYEKRISDIQELLNVYPRKILNGKSTIKVVEKELKKEHIG